MEGHSVISSDVLAAYAADAAREIPGVAGLVESPLPRHRGVRVVEGDDGITIELHLELDWTASAPEVGLKVQERVAAYLGEMAAVTPHRVDVVIAEVAQPPAA
ncbi:MAG: Asp23/Gls24 family envelope stress response protein [Gaiellales bacterium]